MAFGQTLHHTFINYDDDMYVYQNLVVTSGLTRRGILWAFTFAEIASRVQACQRSGLFGRQRHGLDADQASQRRQIVRLQGHCESIFGGGFEILVSKFRNSVARIWEMRRRNTRLMKNSAREKLAAGELAEGRQFVIIRAGRQY